jgi:hypothetical protein
MGESYMSHATPTAPEYGQANYDKPARKKKRIFLWFFLAVQALFIIMIIAGATSSGGDATDCGSLTQETCNAAEDVGTGIGVILIVVIWMVVDFLLALIYGVYRLAKRS